MHQITPAVIFNFNKIYISCYITKSIEYYIIILFIFILFIIAVRVFIQKVIFLFERSLCFGYYNDRPVAMLLIRLELQNNIYGAIYYKTPIVETLRLKCFVRIPNTYTQIVCKVEPGIITSYTNQSFLVKK